MRHRFNANLRAVPQIDSQSDPSQTRFVKLQEIYYGEFAEAAPTASLVEITGRGRADNRVRLGALTRTMTSLKFSLMYI